MLLTLLPFVGWAAEPLSSVKLSVANVPYGTAGLTQQDFIASWDANLVYGTDVIWDGKIYSDQACASQVTELATATVGTYYVKFIGGHFYEGPKICQFQILKAPLYVSILVNPLTGNDPTYVGGKLFTTYGEAFNVAGKKILAYAGLKNNEQFKDVVSGSLTGITVEETDANVTWNCDEDADDPASVANRPAYKATLLGYTSANYELVCVDNFYIKQKNISDGDGLTFVLNPNFANYNGKIQDAKYTITYAGKTLTQAERSAQNPRTYVKENDFKVVYYVATLDADKKIAAVSPDASDPLNANVYATKIVAGENGNYAGEYPAREDVTATSVFGNNPFLWTIKQAGLTIIALDQTKVYDGTNALRYNYDGVMTGMTPEQKAEQKKINDLAVSINWPKEITSDEAAAIMAGVTISVAGTAYVGEKIITPALASTVNNPNYDFNLVQGKLTITKRNLTITASDATKLYTASANPTFSIAYPDGYEFELSAEEREAEDGGSALLARLQSDIFAGTTNGSQDNPASLTFLRDANASSNPGAGLKVSLKAGTYNEVKVYENALEVTYTERGLINNYNVTKVAGNFTISGGKIYITALKQQKNYGAEDPDWEHPVKGTSYRIDGLTAGDKDKDISGLVLSREEGEEVGSYRITASGATVPAGYEDIVYADGEFVINPRPITVTVLTQTMKDGSKVSTLNKTAYTIDNTDENEGLAPGEVAEDIFTLDLDLVGGEGHNQYYNFTSFSAETAGTQYATGKAEFVKYIEDDNLTEIVVVENNNDPSDPFVNQHFFIEANPADGIPVARKQLYSENAKGQLIASGVWVKITKGEDAVVASDRVTTEGNPAKVKLDEDKNSQKFQNSIKVVPVSQDAYANYEFTVKRGSLYVIDKDALVLDDNDENLAENIEAKDGEKRVFVAFGPRVLKKDQWNTLVLPFKTSVSELSETLGYVVVDKLDESNSNTSTIAIKLAFGAIEANTPILVQPEEDVNLADGIFFQKNIIYSDEPKAADNAGHEFIGTYEGHNVMTGDDSEFYYSNGQKQFVHSGNTTKGYVTVGKMRAYLKDTNAGTSSAARMITIEEPNGETNVTAISEVNVDAKASVKAEGWYTINGVKLNAAPTQKGLYINNGKKVIIK